MISIKAIAHPIQGLIKYHGLRDFGDRTPFHSSISACVAPLATEVEVVLREGEDEYWVDGTLIKRGRGRIDAVVNEIRRLAGRKERISVHSHNNFPSGIGLGSSSSGFASLALAAARAFDLALDDKNLSQIARLGSGSAARSVTGRFSELVAGPDAYAYQMDHELEMGICVVPLVKATPTDWAHRTVLSSPFLRARLAYVERALEEMRRAIKEADIAKIGELAERDTLNLHAVTMTGAEGANPLVSRDDTDHGASTRAAG